MTPSPLIALSERVYRALLIFYPADYRREYGADMAQVFRDMCRDSYRQGGVWGVLRSWLPVLLDLAITAFEEHRKEGIRMSKESLIHWSGPILIVGGLLFMVFSFSLLTTEVIWDARGIYEIAFMMIVPALVLLATGLGGVYARFASRINRPGRLGLILAIAAAPAFAVIFLTQVVGPYYTASEAVVLLLFLLPHFGMVLFGISTSSSRVLLRWNALPVLVGMLPFVVVFPQIRNVNQPGPHYFLFSVFAIVGLGYALLGYLVHSDVSRREMVTA
jgi:hypothetical protein